MNTPEQEAKPLYIPVTNEKNLPSFYRIFQKDGKDEMIYFKPITQLSDLPEEWKEKIREIAGESFDAGNVGAVTQQEIELAKQQHLKLILL